MNFGQLKTAVLDTAHRPDLTAYAADFVRRGEGMIRRELRAYPLSYTMTDTDRVAGGVYNLPSGTLEVRAIYGTDAGGNSYALDQVGIHTLRDDLADSAPAAQFCMLGDQVEFRGSPATGTTFTLRYLGMPTALASDSDQNALLTDHEAIYLQSALFHLYQFTEDMELAQAALDTFGDAIEKLNQLYGRKMGGARVAGGYNLSPSGSY
jgi:hypothetical protein